MTKISLTKIPLVVAVLTVVLIPKETRAAAVPETQLPQRITLTTTDIPLVQIFEKIEAVSDYIFVYQEDVASDKTKVSIDVKDADIRDVLGKFFRKTSITDCPEDRFYFIRTMLLPHLTNLKRPHKSHRNPLP